MFMKSSMLFHIQHYAIMLGGLGTFASLDPGQVRMIIYILEHTTFKPKED